MFFKKEIQKIWANKAGQSLGEVLVGLTIGSILIGAASFLVVNSLRSNASLQKSQKATQIAQEMLDKVRSWGSADWFNIYDLSKGSTNKYFLNASGTTLSVISGEEGILSNDITNGLVGYWRLDESTSTVAYDSSGNNNSGTLINSPTRATSTCKVGSCLIFNGTTNYISMVNTTTTKSIAPTGTIANWVYLVTPTSTLQMMVDMDGTGCVSRGLVTMVSPTNFAIQYGGGGGCQRALSTTVPVLNTWFYVVTTWDSSGARIYINGVLEGSSAIVPNFLITNATAYIGSNGGSTRLLNGRLDDIRIYNRALSADEVKKLYQSSVYTRSFSVENVCRSTGATGEITGSGDSCAGGSANDPSTQKITVSVGWQTGVTTTQLMLNDYLTRWKNAIFEQADWSGGVDNSGSYTNSSDSYSSTTNTDLNSGGVILDLP
jgi:type II secretory pathway pseudopilin PulG